jgi:hypothetical protein
LKRHTADGLRAVAVTSKFGTFYANLLSVRQTDAVRIELRPAKRELSDAERAIRGMQSARTMDDLRQAWQDFLHRIERVWIKAERGCQPVRNEFQPWQGSYALARRNDPLLAYLRHARNADEHTIQAIAGVALDIDGAIPPGGTVAIEVDRAAGRVRFGGQVRDCTAGPPRYVLFPFKDSGVEYEPPPMHMGVPVSGDDPFTVAELGLKFYREFVAEAEKKFSTQSEK